ILQRAETSVDRAAQTINKSLDRIEQGFKEVADASDRSMRTVSSRMEDAGNKIQKVGNAVRPVGIALSAIGAILLGPIVLGIKKFADFEQVMANVQAISNTTGKEFESLNDIASKMGETTRFTAIEPQAFSIAGCEPPLVLPNPVYFASYFA
ncbi:MAG: hypothetical protein IIC84_07225, partial [Chloroflexi bacterium]|nr:hypothetical protein [Chloroflexota bacterium]